MRGRPDRRPCSRARVRSRGGRADENRAKTIRRTKRAFAYARRRRRRLLSLSPGFSKIRTQKVVALTDFYSSSSHYLSLSLFFFFFLLFFSTVHFSLPPRSTSPGLFYASLNFLPLTFLAGATRRASLRVADAQSLAAFRSRGSRSCLMNHGLCRVRNLRWRG